MPDLGSDHYGVLFTITLSYPKINSNISRYNTKKADWKLYSETLEHDFKDFHYIVDNHYSTLELDTIAKVFTDYIVKAADISIPKTTISSYAKPWWNDDLKALRKTMNYYSRKAKKDLSYYSALQEAKTSYFKAIKQAKQNHWNSFLEKEDAKAIFKAMSYTKDISVNPIPNILDIETNELKSSFPEKCDVFRKALFPPPPESRATASRDPSSYRAKLEWEWPILSEIELKNACNSKIKGKTPGPDLITQEMIVYAYKAIPHIFYIVYSLLINSGYHPKIWKQATGFILKKPSKPDYTLPKAYRVISLLNCLGKVSERILAQRLSYIAETTTLLHPTQLGGRLKKSAIDAALLLHNEIEQNKSSKLCTSTLFLDVKGAFDHVSKDRLIEILYSLRLPISLITWVSSFLDDRTLRLSFDNNIEGFRSISIGIPQGSPISPILFLIYIRDLFKSNRVKYISYLDDISLTTSSKSYKQNIKVLKQVVDETITLGIKNSISFDIAKTELIHFGKSELTLSLPNKDTIYPKEVVKWLGIHFSKTLKYKEHIAIRASKAKQAFYRVNRLANISRGLSPFALRQLYLACVTSVADYGSILWWDYKNKSLIKPLQAIQNLATRRILGVFKTAPIIPLELESALVPPDIRLSNSLHKYALRILKLSQNHVIRQEFIKLQANIDIDSNSSSEEDITILTKTKSKKKTQIETIYRSISSLVDLNSLEIIKPLYFPPCNKEVPYDIIISKKSKEDTTKLHNKYLLDICSNSSITSIYTDASQTIQGIGVGIGLCVYDHVNSGIPQVPIYSEKWNIGELVIVYNGELEGVTRAIEYASSVAKEGEVYNIYTDNQAVLLRLKTPSDNPGQSHQIRAIIATKATIAKGAKIVLNWVPGHTDIIGNEEADKLAKAATLIEPNHDHVTSFAYYGYEVNMLKKHSLSNCIESYYERNQNSHNNSYSKIYPSKILSKIALPLGTNREHASALYQLKIGHGYIKSYLYQLGHVQNNRCTCGAIESPKHLLLECRVYNKERRVLFNKIKQVLRISNITLLALLHTKQGIESTLVFLKDTKISTRPWHTQRIESHA